MSPDVYFSNPGWNANDMSKPRILAVLAAALIILAAIVLVIDRGGLIAWTAVVAGAGMLAKIGLKPSRFDVGLSVGLAVLLILTWLGSRHYVISTWESGEVVELAMDTSSGPHTARVWVLDIGDQPHVYYDAEPEVAASLLAGKPLRFTRSGEVSTRIPQATRADALPQADAQRVLEAMQTKYGDRVAAADVYYLMLGRSRDRVAVVARLVEGVEEREK